VQKQQTASKVKPGVGEIKQPTLHQSAPSTPQNQAEDTLQSLQDTPQSTLVQQIPQDTQQSALEQHSQQHTPRNVESECTDHEDEADKLLEIAFQNQQTPQSGLTPRSSFSGSAEHDDEANRLLQKQDALQIQQQQVCLFCC
jgi:hypothetical protein